MTRSKIVAMAVLVALALALPLGAASAQQPINLTIVAVGGSGVTGTATLTPRGNKTAVQVQVKGFPANTGHPSHFHTGTCANPGPPQIPLPNLDAGADGSASYNTEVDTPLAMLTDGNHFFMTHVGPAPAVGPGVACGDILAAQVMPGGLPRTGDLGLTWVLVAAGGLLLGGALLRRRPA